MESKKLEVSLKEIWILTFKGDYTEDGLLTYHRKKRLYNGINWKNLGIQDSSNIRIKIWLLRINRDAYPEEVIEAVKSTYGLPRPLKELPLCLLKKLPRKKWDPALVFLHEPIKQPQREFAHFLVLSGSRLSAARVGNKKPFHKDCLFVYAKIYK